MKQLLGILTSRWLQAMVLLLWIAALRMQMRWLLFVAAGLASVVVAALLMSFTIGMRRGRSVWKKFPDTPAYTEYAAERGRKIKKDDKNHIDIG